MCSQKECYIEIYFVPENCSQRNNAISVPEYCSHRNHVSSASIPENYSETNHASRSEKREQHFLELTALCGSPRFLNLEVVAPVFWIEQTNSMVHAGQNTRFSLKRLIRVEPRAVQVLKRLTRSSGVTRTCEAFEDLHGTFLMLNTAWAHLPSAVARAFGCYKAES